MNQDNGGKQVHHGMAVDMFEPDEPERELSDASMAVIAVCMALGCALAGLLIGLTYGWWMR